MTVILGFIAMLALAALWWLLGQGVTSKPWLETGAEPVASAPPPPVPAPGQAGLGVVIVVVGALFALFGSAFVMRMEAEPWSGMRLPPMAWAGTAALVLGCLALERAARQARAGDGAAARREGALALLATAGFLAAQLWTWQALGAAGAGLTSGPAASFFYLLSGLHGLHVIGGLVALGLLARAGGDAGDWTRRARLCAAYWHFLLLIWLGILALLAGWGNRFLEICRGIVL